MFRKLANEAPLILALEDVHWADPATVDFLHVLARRLPRDRWLVLATYRPEELERAESLRRLRQELSRERLAQELVLKPLDADETSALVDSILGALAPSPQPFARWIHNYGEGNPFFTEEILRAAVESSDAHLLRLDVEALGNVTVPATVREAIVARIEQLPPAGRAVAAAAATMGRTVDLDALQQIAGLTGDAFTQAFMHLLSLHLVRADRTPIRYAFRHHLIREVMLQSIAPDERRRLHQQVGEYLERSSGPPQLLAHHFRQAGDRERTARHALAAAREASTVYAHEDAAGYFAAALEAIPEPDAESRVTAAEGWGDALFHGGRLADALQAYSVMHRTAEAAGMMRETARALRKIGRTQNEQSPGSAMSAFEKALSILAAIDDPAEEAMIREQASKAAFFLGQFGRGVAEAEAALAAGVRAKDTAAQSRAYKSLALNLDGQGRREHNREYLQRAVALAVEAGDLEAELKALNDTGWEATADGDFVQARAAWERAAKLVEKVGELPTLLLPIGGLAWLSFCEGHWDEAERLWRRTTTIIADRFGRVWPFAHHAPGLALVRLLRGHSQEATGLLDEAQGAAQAASDAWSLSEVDGVRALMALKDNEPERAQAILEGALSRQGVPAGTTEDTRLLLAETLTALGRPSEAAAELCAAMEMRPARLRAPRIARLRGAIAALEGRPNDAVQAFQAGLEEMTRVHQPYEEARLRHDLGVCLLRRGQRGDRKAAREHLLVAAEIFDGLGAAPDASRTRQALRRISGRKPSGTGLTEREQEVLSKLTEGLSNAAIAVRLYISERTVEVHVSHILGKLGVETRTQATAWAMRHLSLSARKPPSD